MAPDSTTSLSWEYIAPVDSGELIFAGTFSAKDDYYGTYDQKFIFLDQVLILLLMVKKN